MVFNKPNPEILELSASQVIVKRLVKAGDHPSAAIMLVRVAKNIQQFPAHVVPILTSVVIECQRAKMIGESYQYACTLMKPEYRKDGNWEVKPNQILVDVVELFFFWALIENGKLTEIGLDEWSFRVLVVPLLILCRYFQSMESFPDTEQPLKLQ